MLIRLNLENGKLVGKIPAKLPREVRIIVDVSDLPEAYMIDELKAAINDAMAIQEFRDCSYRGGVFEATAIINAQTPAA